MSKTITSYIPDFLVLPGEVLEDYLDSYGMTQAELADRTGMAKKTVNEIIKGKAAITPDSALKFERVFRRPASFWNSLERQFQEDQVRLAEKERLSVHLEWLKRIPVRTMAKYEWIKHFADPFEQLEEILHFFGIASPDQWKKVWKGHQVAYRQTQRFEACAEAVSAWLRQGEIEAQKITCGPFDKKGFQEALDQIRSLTQEVDPKVFCPKLIEMCSKVGVAVIFVRELPKTGVSGATRWIGDKAIIQLSLRYKCNDQLWFTFFHEAGHIVKHGKKEIFIEGNGMDGEKEAEANRFSCDKLINPLDIKRFLSYWDRRSLSVIPQFASEIGVAPGIVVGRLQHDGLLRIPYGNKLKVYYEWKQS
jgi:HTH-type transcriptional regulator / antitoxin HigA